MVDPVREETLAKITLKELEKRARWHEIARRSPWRVTYLVYIIALWAGGLFMAMILDLEGEIFFTTMGIAQVLTFFLIWESQVMHRRLDALLKLLDLQVSRADSPEAGA